METNVLGDPPIDIEAYEHNDRLFRRAVWKAVAIVIFKMAMLTGIWVWFAVVVISPAYPWSPWPVLGSACFVTVLFALTLYWTIGDAVITVTVNERPDNSSPRLRKRS